MTDIPKNGSANPGPYGMAPYDGLKPTTPTCAGGRRLEPPASVPIASGTRPAATAVAGPPDDPPGVKSGLSGCRVGPKRSDVVTPLQANSDVAPMPTTTAPASLRRSMATASRGAMKSAKSLEPCVTRQPSTQILSFA